MALLRKTAARSLCLLSAGEFTLGEAHRGAFVFRNFTPIVCTALILLRFRLRQGPLLSEIRKIPRLLIRIFRI